MSSFSTRESLNFDDVHMITSRVGIVSSRSQVQFNNNRIIVAPMSAIQNSDFNKACVQNGLSLPVHRFCSPEEQFVLMTEAIEMAQLVKSKSKLWLAVGLKDWKERFELNKKLLDQFPFEIMLDVAYCHTLDCIDEIKKIKNYTKLSVDSGNVHTGIAANQMFDFCKRLRCGIGAGEACLTTPNTGIGRGQLSVVLDCVEANPFEDGVISDGGIRKPGDVAKAFAAGASSVMIGGMFKTCVESESFKTGRFYGGASSVAKEIVGNENRYIEGRSIDVVSNEQDSVKSVSDAVADGVRSAISYSGYSDIKEYIGNGVFEKKH